MSPVIYAFAFIIVANYAALAWIYKNKRPIIYKKRWFLEPFVVFILIWPITMIPKLLEKSDLQTWLFFIFMILIGFGFVVMYRKNWHNVYSFVGADSNSFNNVLNLYFASKHFDYVINRDIVRVNDLDLEFKIVEHAWSGNPSLQPLSKNKLNEFQSIVGDLSKLNIKANIKSVLWPLLFQTFMLLLLIYVSFKM